MQRRILVAEDSPPIVAALRRDAGVLDLELDVSSPAGAVALFDPERHALAVVRGTAEGRQVAAALRAADPGLPIVALFLDEDEARKEEPVEGAEGALVGPLNAAATQGAFRLALGLRMARERADAAEARAARVPRPGHELEFLKRLILVEVKRSRRYRFPVSLAIVALDRWPEAAAALAPRERVVVLADVLAILTRTLRDIDVVVPFPEDRFLVLVPHTNRAGALQAAGRICARVREHPGLVRLTASAGVASHEGDGTAAFGSLVKRAAGALSRARAEGGDRAASADAPPKRDRIVMG